jgi:hypothetical protein
VKRESAQQFTMVHAKADDVMSIVIPALEVPGEPEGYTMQYMLQAIDLAGRVIYEQGTLAHPLTFLVAPRPTGPSPLPTLLVGAVLTAWLGVGVDTVVVGIEHRDGFSVGAGSLLLGMITLSVASWWWGPHAVDD